MEEESLKYYTKALHLAKKINHTASIAIALHGIGNIYSDIEDFKQAIPYFYKSLEIERKRGNKMGVEYSLANLAEAYTMLHQKDSAEKYIMKMLGLAQQLYGKNLGIEYNLLGKYNYEFGNYKEAIKNYEQSVRLVKSANIKRYIANGYIMLGKSFLAVGEKKKALENILKGLKIAKEIGSKENIKLGYKALMDYALAETNYKDAFLYKTQMEDYEDSIINLNIRQNMEILNVLYETREKDNKIKQLAYEKKLQLKENKRMHKFLITLIIISLLIITLLLYIMKLRKKNNDIRLEAKNQEIQQYLQQLHLLDLKENPDSTSKTDESDNGNNENYVDTELFCQRYISEYNLTVREYEVLKLICDGLSNDEISKKLFISKNTVKTHIRNIYEKLDVKNRREVFKKLYEIN
jgi:ATP/maltotriose-dependent transcriptional regulator MalT